MAFVMEHLGTCKWEGIGLLDVMLAAGVKDQSTDLSIGGQPLYLL